MISTIGSINYICAMQVVKNNTQKIIEHPDTPLAVVFNLLAKKYYGAISKQLNELEFDKYFFVLYQIVKNQKSTQQCLADSIQVDKATMVRMIDYLTDKGLVKREQCTNDRRSYYVVATAKATKVLPQIELTYQQINKAAFKGVNKAEQKVFNEVLLKMMSNLQELPGEKFELKYIKK